MKIIDDVKIYNAATRAGCVCSSGQANTRGAFAPIWNCNCQCSGGAANNNSNHTKADRV